MFVRTGLTLVLSFSLASLLPAQTGLINTIAGTGVSGNSGVGGPATSAQLGSPAGIAVDSSDNLFIADPPYNRVLRVDAATGTLTLYAGNGQAAYSGDGGPATSAAINNPVALALDPAGNLFISERRDGYIRRVDAVTGIITTVAGNGAAGFAGDGGPATSASLQFPSGIALDSAGNLFIADFQNFRIRRVDAQSGIITTVAGNGSSAIAPDGSAAATSSIAGPYWVSFDRSGSLLVSEYLSGTIRRIDASSGILSTVAGNGGTTYNGDGIPATSAALNKVGGNVAVDAGGNMFFADALGRIRRVDAASGQIITMAGNGSGAQDSYSTSGAGGFTCYSEPLGDGGPATSATMDGPGSIAFTRNGNLLFSDSLDCRVRRVSLPSPYVYTNTSIAANPTSAQQGQTVTITATVTAIGSGGIPTGSIQFIDGPQYIGNGSMTLGTAPIVNGVATLFTVLPNGSHFVAAYYSGDSTFNSSGSGTVTISVTNQQKPTATVTITSNQNPAPIGVSVPFTIAVTGAPQPTGTVLLYLGSTVVGTGTLVNGQAQVAMAFYGSGSYTMGAVYLGDNTYGQSAAPTITQNIRGATTLSIGESPTGPQTYGTTIQIGAGVTPSSATGTLQFVDNSTAPATVLGTATINGGGGFISVSTLSIGTHQIVANYSGDATNSPATSSTLTQIITSPTTVTLTSSGSPSTSGQPVTLTASVSPMAATGSVQFLDGSSVIATGTLSGGSAVVSVNLSAGSHSLTASYQGDGTYLASTSSAVSQVVNKASPSLTLTSSQNPSDPNQSVTFTAAVSLNTATGSVQFLDGATVLATAPLSGTVATYSTSTLASASHSITAVYSGDANDNGATSPAVAQVVRTVTTTSVTSNINPSVVGGNVLLIASVTGSGATGAVQFLDGATVLGTGPVSIGSASLNAGDFTNGTHNITAVYSGDGNFTPSTSAVYVQTMKLASNMNITVDNASPAYGQAIKLQAFVSPTAATGTVTFQEGSAAIGTGTLANGVTSLSLSTLAVGAHQITALYSGDSTYGNCGSPQVLTVTVSKATPTETAGSSLNPSVAGQSVTFTATVSPATATGTVQFLDGSTVLGTSAVGNGAATYSTAALAAGSHTITASYSGDGNYNTVSASVAQTVQAVTTATLSANNTAPSFGLTVQLTASVSPAAATGTVQFLDGAAVLGTAAVNGGIASLSTSTLAAGSHSITAVYSGDSNDAGSTSAAVVVTVSKANSSATVTSSLNPSVSGQSVTFTATISPSTASGTVQFLDGSTVLGTSTASNGVATYSTSALSAGGHTISASYSGDANYNAASATAAQTVKASTATTLSANNTSPTYGQTVQLTAMVSPGAATGTVQFLDGSTVLATVNLSGGSASFSTNALATGSHSFTAAYSGDSLDTASTSGAVSVTVSKVTSAVGLASSLNPSIAGQPVTFTATVSPASAGGTVQFLDGSTVLATVNVSSGTAAYGTNALATGNHSITAAYSGDANDTAANSSVLSQTVNVPIPGAPTNLAAAAASSSQINLTWTASPTLGVTYDVYSSTASGFTPSASNRIASGVAGTSYSNTGLAPASTHYYLVTAVNSAGESSPANQAGAKTLATGTACSVGYSVTSQWSNGFGTAITITNTGSTTINGWDLSWSWSGNQQITQSWDSNYVQHGKNASLTNLSWDSTIAPGATLSGIGFNASYSGANVNPTTFSVNGVKCH